MENKTDEIMNKSTGGKNVILPVDDGNKEHELAPIKYFDTDYALVTLHADSEMALKEILNYVEEKRFITARIYYKKEDEEM